MSDKINEINFEELWQKICELKDAAIKADDAGLLLDGLYDNDVNFVITDIMGFLPINIVSLRKNSILS